MIAGLHLAFRAKSELNQGHLQQAIAETLPLSTTLREEIGRLREWAKARTRPASA